MKKLFPATFAILAIVLLLVSCKQESQKNFKTVNEIFAELPLAQDQIGLLHAIDAIVEIIAASGGMNDSIATAIVFLINDHESLVFPIGEKEGLLMIVEEELASIFFEGDTLSLSRDGKIVSTFKEEGLDRVTPEQFMFMWLNLLVESVN